MKEFTEVLKNKMIEVQNVLGDAIKDLESMIAKPTPSDEMGKLRFNKPSDQDIAWAKGTADESEEHNNGGISWAFGVYKQLVAFMQQEKQETDQALGEFIDRSQRLEKNVEAKKALISQLIDKANNGQTWVKVIRKERDESRAKADLFENKWVDEVEKQKVAGYWPDVVAELNAELKSKQKEIVAVEANAAHWQNKADDFEGRVKIADHDKDDLREELDKVKADAEGGVNAAKGLDFWKHEAGEKSSQLARVISERGHLIDQRAELWNTLDKQVTELKASENQNASLKREIDLASEKIKELKECRETPPCTDHTWIRERIKGKLWEFCAPRLVE